MQLNPELQSRYVQRGFFPPSEELATNLSKKCAAFYELLLGEWEESGCRTIVRSRVHVIAKQAGYSQAGSAERTLERKCLMRFRRTGKRKPETYVRDMIARPFVRQGSKSVIMPDQCLNQGVSLEERVWCLPKNTASRLLATPGEGRLYEAMLAAVLGCGTNLQTHKSIRLIASSLRLLDGDEIVSELLRKDFLRSLNGDPLVEGSVYTLVVRPYKIRRAFPGQEKGLCFVVPDLCQPKHEDLRVEEQQEVVASAEEVSPTVSLENLFDALYAHNRQSALRSLEAMERLEQGEFLEIQRMIENDPCNPEIVEQFKQVRAHLDRLRARMTFLQSRKQQIDALAELFH
jgi:hypothetical protein